MKLLFAQYYIQLMIILIVFNLLLIFFKIKILGIVLNIPRIRILIIINKWNVFLLSLKKQIIIIILIITFLVI